MFGFQLVMGFFGEVMGEDGSQVVIKPVMSSFEVAFCGQYKDASRILSQLDLDTPVSSHEYLSNGVGFFLVVFHTNWDGVIKDAVVEALDWNG